MNSTKPFDKIVEEVDESQSKRRSSSYSKEEEYKVPDRIEFKKNEFSFNIQHPTKVPSKEQLLENMDDKTFFTYAKSAHKRHSKS